MVKNRIAFFFQMENESGKSKRNRIDSEEQIEDASEGERARTRARLKLCWNDG